MKQNRFRIRNIFILIIKGYQAAISPFLPKVCRFYPSCSDYMIEAIQKHGMVYGITKGLIRIIRCQPLSKGGIDPV